jgi:adenosylcobyric acid synthase
MDVQVQEKLCLAWNCGTQGGDDIPAKPIMIQGTASGVGKTMITMALCRIFMRDGYKVAPFKSQNMTSNTAYTKCGCEIAISQFLQAYAAGLEPEPCMNPVILKPATEIQATKVILNGHPHETISADNAFLFFCVYHFFIISEF